MGPPPGAVLGGLWLALSNGTDPEASRRPVLTPSHPPSSEESTREAQAGAHHLLLPEHTGSCCQQTGFCPQPELTLPSSGRGLGGTVSFAEDKSSHCSTLPSGGSSGVAQSTQLRPEGKPRAGRREGGGCGELQAVACAAAGHTPFASSASGRP